MSETDNAQPPQIRRREDGSLDTAAAADVIEWFLTYDERTARIRHPHSDELFRWKQADDEANGVGTYPFENAEARFAIGAVQALQQNDGEPLLKLWITDVLAALHSAREHRNEMNDAYGLNADAEASPLVRAEKLPSGTERRLYLTSCWLETLCTAEARVLGWIYQDLYGKPFAP